ncbi:hypothetical protein [Paenarthrobacter aurescens]|uniref:hypothetical protein n=1 Tax=Paenarthrobacter aurescens TaxID=43663 RepID=UPI0031D438DD
MEGQSFIMSQQLPLDELTLTLARIRGLLLTEEKVDRAVQLLAEGVRDAFPAARGRASRSLMSRATGQVPEQRTLW